MKRYLFAAEADKIQDFVFRSSRLQEVMGGSMLLTRFCQEGLPALADHSGERDQAWGEIVNDGGSFRIWFADPAQAQQFGGRLQEMYRRAAGGALTIAPQPEAYEAGNDADFDRANQVVSRRLRQAKSDGGAAQPLAHLPQMAFCASCGLTVATRHALFHETAIYHCAECRAKLVERRGSWDSQFMRPFKDALLEHNGALQESQLYIPIDAVDAIGHFDPRGYVAYLIADGNGMGELFGRLHGEEALRTFSTELTDNVRDALAAPAGMLRERTAEVAGARRIKLLVEEETMALRDVWPLVPLILGGDDIFALLPAPFALDFAHRFCIAFEREMSHAMDEAQLTDERPTMSAVVVICKRNDPYKVAHAYGHTLLAAAKRLSRSHPDGPRSVVDVAVIRGNEMAGADDGAGAKFRPSLRPYWADQPADALSIPLELLLEARLKLAALPRGRLPQLAELFEGGRPKDAHGGFEQWQGRLEWLLGRVARDGALGKTLSGELDALGSSGDHAPWRAVRRGQSPYQAHALPDLIKLWEFAYKLDTPQAAYREREGA